LREKLSVTGVIREELLHVLEEGRKRGFRIVDKQKPCIDCSEEPVA